MHNVFTLIRYGFINLKGAGTSTVQCTGVGHYLYKYSVKILYKPDIQLNPNGWLIDNNTVDAAVQKVHVNSCELMQVEMMEEVKKVLSEEGLPFMAIKITLWPHIVVEEKHAEFILYHLTDDLDSTLLVLL